MEETEVIQTCKITFRAACTRIGLIVDHRSDNSYPSQANDGYSSRPVNPYAQQDNGRYEMANVNNSTTHLAAGDSSDMSGFYTEVSARLCAQKYPTHQSAVQP